MACGSVQPLLRCPLKKKEKNFRFIQHAAGQRHTRDRVPFRAEPPSWLPAVSALQVGGSTGDAFANGIAKSQESLFRIMATMTACLYFAFIAFAITSEVSFFASLFEFENAGSALARWARPREVRLRRSRAQK